MQPDIQIAVGRRIAAIRKRKGISQDELARLSGLNRAHLYRLETGQQIMTIRTLKVLADSLEISVSRIMRGL